MRIRIFGQYVQLSIALLTGAEAMILCGALIAAVLLEQSGSLSAVSESAVALWPRALVFSGAMVVSLLALGLYSARQRARAGGMIARIALAILSGAAVTWIVFRVVPTLSV